MKHILQLTALFFAMLFSTMVYAQQDVFNKVRSTIIEIDDVTDASILRNGKKLSLVLVVKNYTTVLRARELCDSFIRLTMNRVKAENKPVEELGVSVNDYIIGVYYPDDLEIALGVKANDSIRISWQ
jgi:hypothetical protein